MPRVTTQERDQFEKLGYFNRENVFSKRELADLIEAVESVHEQILEAGQQDDAEPIDQIDNQKYQEICGSTIKWEWDDDLRAVRSMEPVYHLEPRLSDLIDDPRIWGPCADIIGCQELSLFSDKLNVKRSGGAPFPWHQEGPYWAFGAQDLERVITLILYLDDATVDNGCLWLIPGSHQYGPLDCHQDQGTLGRLYTDISQLREEPIPMDLPAGSISFFHYNIVHGSQTNQTAEDRRAFLIAYQPANLVQWRNRQLRNIPPQKRP